MGHLFNRRILLAVCGGIAAYKSAEIVRALQERGAEVRVLMTRGAQEFITPLTLQALSGFPVHHSLLDEEAERGMGHIELARWADLMLIAPATADCMARLRAGRADDLLGAVALATSAPLVLAPAMNQQMWRDAATQDNLSVLRDRGIRFIGPAAGEQACGDIGPGRMSEAADIAAAVDAGFASRDLDGMSVLVTAGPTREAIDPVRFLSNHSSGRMGFAIARAAADAGARTELVCGPVQLPTPEHVRRHDVQTACEMLERCEALADDCDVFIACAAVADYRPATVAAQKIKKSDTRLTLELERNPDILAQIAARADAPFCVGFAAETQKLREHALAKLEAKALDLIVANDVSDPSIGFNSDENAALLLWHGGERSLERASKDVLARSLVSEIAARLRERTAISKPQKK
jgi:phosphopantothenoylcysteine decarboxylase/phosphopantothenate--cysteine ligase